MKANELMIGDWVCHKDWPSIPIRVCRISERVSFEHSLFWNEDSREYVRRERYSEADYDEITPTILTPEILEKNGFEKQQGYFGSVFAFDDDDKDTHVIIHPKENNYTRGAYTYIHVEHGCLSLDELPLEYIHELQHALKLCGIEKQIEL